MIDEENLIKALARGEEYALEILFEQHYEPLWKYSLAILKNPHDAGEVVNDTFFRAFRYARSFAGEGSFSGWLFRIARNQCIDSLKKHNHKIETVPDIQRFEKGNNEPPASGMLKIDDALEKMKPEHREVIILKDISGYSLGEISRMTGRSPSSVKSLHYRAMKALGRLLNGEEGGNPDEM